VARVVALVPDLLFGSKVQAMLAEAGHEVSLVAGVEDAAGAGADVLVVDLTGGLDPATVPTGSARTLAFYSHVEPEVRERALAAGIDEVVPRSRMNREGGELVTRLAARS
jgi:hypothetical protein